MTGMLTLFDLSPEIPEGFSYYPGFISQEEEIKILDNIKHFDLQPMRFHEYEAKRKVIHFGKGWSFTQKKLVPGAELPSEFNFLIDRVAAKLNVTREHIAQFLITQYPVGSVINWHRDAPPFDMIAGVSLQSACSFRLRPHDKPRQTKNSTLSFQVERRSLYIMQGSARSEWQHSIAPVDKIRFSLTFRTLKQPSSSHS